MMGTTLSPNQIAQLAYDAGFRGNDLATAVAVALAESGGDAQSVNTAGNTPAGSRDRGLWQFNDYWNSDVPDSCAFDPQCAAQAAYRTFQQRGWGDWVTFTTGATNRFMATAQQAAASVGGAASAVVSAVGSLLSSFYANNITQPYGPTSETMEPAYGGYPHFHMGMDFSGGQVVSGAPIPSLSGGTVSQAGWNDGFGNSVTVKMPNGQSVLYGHMSELRTAVGQTVNAGDTLGLVGSTGNSTGPHVHVQLMDASGAPLDPTQFIENAKGGGLNMGPFQSVTGALGDLTGVVSQLGKVGDALSTIATTFASVLKELQSFFDALGRLVGWVAGGKAKQHWLKLLFTGVGLVLIVVGFVVFVVDPSEQTAQTIGAAAV